MSAADTQRQADRDALARLMGAVRPGVASLPGGRTRPRGKGYLSPETAATPEPAVQIEAKEAATVAVFGPYPATVLDVHDGDTMRLDLDLGFGVHQVALACRLFGINAPELATVAGKAAHAFALTLVKPGDRVTVVSHGWDKYGGRFDGQIQLADGTDFAARMLASGNAAVMAAT